MATNMGAIRPTSDEIARGIATKLFPNDQVRMLQALAMISRAITETVATEVLARIQYEEGLRKAAQARVVELEAQLKAGA